MKQELLSIIPLRQKRSRNLILVIMLLGILLTMSISTSPTSSNGFTGIDVLDDSKLIKLESIHQQDLMEISDESETNDTDAWNLEMINIHGAWDITRGSEDISVAVVDTGVTFNDQVTTDNRWENTIELNGEEGVDDDENGYVDDYYGWDFYTNDNDPETHNETVPNLDHGTEVAGVIVAQHNDIPAAGVAPNVKIMNLKIFGTDGTVSGFSDSVAAEAINYAIDNNASVINLSLAGDIDPASFRKAIDRAASMGIPVVAAAGNSGGSNIVGREKVQNPGAYESTIAVGGLTSYKTRWEWSSYGAALDLTAPGLSVPTINGIGGNIGRTGTSFATPHVAGIIALMLSVRSDLPTKYIEGTIYATAEDLGDPGRDDEYGWGLPDATVAVSSWQNFENEDFDQDGLTSQKEMELGLDPFVADSDADQVNDGDEVDLGLDPLSNDTDGDTVLDGIELELGIDPLSTDTDQDGMDDGWEIKYDLDPKDASDAEGDLDDDGATNLEEYEAGTDPTNPNERPDRVPFNTMFIVPSLIILAVISSMKKRKRTNFN